MKVFFVQVQNLILFVTIALWRGTPFELWPYAWQEVKAAHEAEVRKVIWELKKQGKIREDKDGYLWPVERGIDEND